MREVELQATVLAPADLRRLDDQAFLGWNHQVNLGIYRNPSYRAVMAFMSPRTLLERGAARWDAFHRGTTLTVRRGEGVAAAEADLRFPAHLITPLLLRGYADAFRAALVHSRAPDALVELRQADETSALFVARWS
jgi:hypothetical protein